MRVCLACVLILLFLGCADPSSGDSRLELTPEEQAWIDAHPKIRVGAEGGEIEPHLGELTEGLVERRDVSRIPGVACPGGAVVRAARPLQDLDSLPFPDYSDFPWDAYPNRILPMLTGRGCGWGVCDFCSDVITSSGRRFRSRSPGSVLNEMQYLHERHDSRLFCFLDLKLNSDQAVWLTLGAEARSIVPGAIWSASIHVGNVGEQGLGAAELTRARKNGLVRMTAGLESGSQRVLDSMAKGTDPDVFSAFLRRAHEAKITMRLTAMIGTPGEEPDDIRATARFLEEHAAYVDRVVLNRYSIQLGTTAHRRLTMHAERYPSISDVSLDLRTATCSYVNSALLTRHHRRAALKLLRVVHRINRKPHTQFSREFEGVM